MTQMSHATPAPSAPEKDLQSLDMRIREGIRAKIISGKLQGGAHLSELKISKDFKVSRTPVREALCALAADGLVEMIPHRGAFVQDVPPATRHDQLHTYGLLASLAAASAANSGSMEARMCLEVDLQDIQKAETPEAFNTALTAFVANIFAAGQSETLNDAANMIARRAPVVALYADVLADKETLFKHANQAFQAIKQSDAPHAENAIRHFFATLNSAYQGQSTTTRYENTTVLPGAEALKSALTEEMAARTNNPFATTHKA